MYQTDLNDRSSPFRNSFNALKLSFNCFLELMLHFTSGKNKSKKPEAKLHYYHTNTNIKNLFGYNLKY